MAGTAQLPAAPSCQLTSLALCRRELAGFGLSKGSSAWQDLLASTSLVLNNLQVNVKLYNYDFPMSVAHCRSLKL